MEVYVLDSLLRREHVIDKFESLIWTERMRAYGDFELILDSILENKTRITAGSKLAMNESYRVMIAETIEDTTDSQGEAKLKIKGRSLEAILLDRIAKPTLSDLTTTPKWVITDTPANIARKIFHDICVLGLLDPGDIIPFVIEGSIFPEDTIGEPSEIITVEIEPTTVYDAIKNLCELYDMGFRLVRNFDTSQLYWDVYMGSDRTTQQTSLPAVVFAPDLDNLQNTTELTTIALYKNVAYVFSPVGYEVVYPLDVDPETSGFERRALFIKADDITDEDPFVASEKMIQRGKEALAQSRRFQAFDGELNQNSDYKYQQHYYLGDLVEIRSETGAANTMQVTEQIFVSDGEGDRSYPTLSINTFITPGSWLAWDYNQRWEDLDPSPETWSDQP
jgi:hypothetical protein